MNLSDLANQGPVVFIAIEFKTLDLIRLLAKMLCNEEKCMLPNLDTNNRFAIYHNCHVLGFVKHGVYGRRAERLFKDWGHLLT